MRLDRKHQPLFDRRADLNITRRQFLTGLAAGSAALALGGTRELFSQALSSGAGGALPKPSQSGIEHIVLVMMENRSFDHFLGWVPNANGRQAGLTYTDKSGQLQSTYHLTDFQGCAHPDPDHSYQGGRIEYDNGACDGWLQAGNNDVYAIGYYEQSDLPFFGVAATAWTTFSSYFAAIMAETYPNRIYQHAAQTDRLTNTNTISKLPTIWDRLAAAGISGRYYYSDVPTLALWGSKYLNISRPAATFLTDAAAGTLPQVSFVDPRVLGESNGISGDDHPHGDIRDGEAFLSQIYTAVTSGPQWSSTVLVINFDEWGGFFEHVPPPLAPVPPGDRTLHSDGRLGFRVPCLLISPWSRRGYVSGVQFDHTSVLNMIEWRWGLRPLTIRDSTAKNLALALDFSQQQLNAPSISVARCPYGGPCPLGSPVTDEAWAGLQALAAQYGWPV